MNLHSDFRRFFIFSFIKIWYSNISLATSSFRLVLRILEQWINIFFCLASPFRFSFMIWVLNMLKINFDVLLSNLRNFTCRFGSSLRGVWLLTRLNVRYNAILFRFLDYPLLRKPLENIFIFWPKIKYIFHKSYFALA